MEGREMSRLRGVFATLRLIVFGFALMSLVELSSTTADLKYQIRGTPMHKVLLTQKGYIQFLRWELPVPEVREFTFCLWVVSNDLTHPHSIFSYSRNERDRLVRSWISSQGRHVYLEIDGKTVFAARTKIRENRWYHVCQSWESKTGRYALWIDGRLKVEGYSEKTINHVIPKGGDIVLGQEYTDFDKGLEEGIEGAVLGFNLLLASSFSPVAKSYGEATHDSIPRSMVSSYSTVPFVARIPMKIMQPDIDYETRIPYVSFRERGLGESTDPFGFFPKVARIARGKRSNPVRRPSSSNSSGNFTRSGRDVFGALSIARGRSEAKLDGFTIERFGPRRDPLGLQLVKLSYEQCWIGRGSPFIGGPLMLISWSRTPVRVFGGATVKNVRSECGNF